METPNVIFIVLDTLRKDYASIIENSLSRLGFIRYENVITPSPWTLPAHASMFSGLYPIMHGAHETRELKNVKVRFKGPNSVLDYFNNLDYETYLLSANMFVSPEFGFSGFDRFWDIYPSPPFSVLSKAEKDEVFNLWVKSERSKIGILNSLINSKKYGLLFKLSFNFVLIRLQNYYRRYIHKWPIEKGAKHAINLVRNIQFDGPTFVFINLMEVHHPLFLNPPISFYLNFKPDKISEQLVQLWRRKYADATAYLNSKLLELMSVLKSKGVFDNSIIVVVSDHGELIGEHGKILHGTFLYDELLRVPLLIKYPAGMDIDICGIDGYISLVALPRFLKLLVSGKISSDRYLYSDVVFSESYGVANPVNQSLLSDEEKRLYEEFNKYRIAVYKSKFKGIFNVSDWKFEQLISYDPRIDITQDVAEQMKKEVLEFLKRGTVMKLRKLKI